MLILAIILLRGHDLWLWETMFILFSFDGSISSHAAKRVWKVLFTTRKGYYNKYKMFFMLCRFRITTLRLCQSFDVWSCKRSSRGCKIKLLVNVEFIHGTCFISFISGQFGFLDSNSRATILVTLVILDRKSIPNLQCWARVWQRDRINHDPSLVCLQL